MSFATMYSDDSDGSRGYVSDFQCSPNSEAVSPIYLKIEEPTNKPYLEIIEQPADFRYRYEKEKYHGHILGVSSPATKKKDLFKFPSVKVCNYDSDVIVRCWLITADLNEHGQAHVHKLCRKVPKAQVHLEPHDLYATVKNGFIATFDYMYIVHAVGGEESDLKIYESKKNWLESGSFNRPPSSSSKPVVDLEELKQMDKNQSILLFQAFDAYTKEKICESAVSRKIKNLHNAETAALKITNYSLAKGSCKGKDEVFMLVEKISKDVEVVFFTTDKSNKKRTWEARAIYGPQHVHHQYAIVFKTPEYCNTNISSPVEVFVELHRKTDGSRSEPVRFTYLPEEMCNLNDFSRKRPHSSETQTCLNNIMLSEASQPKRLKEMVIPDSTTLSENCDKDLIFSILHGIPPEEENLFSLLESNDLISADFDLHNCYEELQPNLSELLINPSLQSDSGPCGERKAQENGHITETSLSGGDDMSDSNPIIEETGPEYCDVRPQMLVEILKIEMNFKENLNCLRALNNILVYKPENYVSLFMAFFRNISIKGFDINTMDFGGNSIFLLACYHSREVVSFLLGFKKLNRNIMNLAGDNALHCASRGNKIDIVQELIKYNFDPNSMNYKSGDTSLHIAVENNNISLSKLLIENGADPLNNNFASVSPYDNSASLENEEFKRYIYKKAQESLKKKPFKISPSSAYFAGESEITSKLRSLKNKFHQLPQKTIARRMILHVVIPVVICSIIYLFYLLS